MSQDTENSVVDAPEEMAKILMQKDKKGSCGKIGIALAVLVGLGVGYGAARLASGESEEQPIIMSVAEKTDAAKGAEAVKALNDTARAALIASRFGLMYMNNGGAAYSGGENYSSEERVMQFPVQHGACFIGFDGKERNFYAFIQDSQQSKARVQNWLVAMKAIGAATDAAVFAPLADEVKTLALLAVKHHVNNMPTELRAAWLAEKARLLFTAQGDTCYTGRVSHERVPGTHVETVSREVTDKTLFADSRGRKLPFNYTVRKYAGNRQASSAWKYASYCTAVVGTEAVLEAFAAEIESMKKAAAKR